ncbi:MAG: ROK family protein [Verrucomicrobiae bacterium]|nr:ROK family protein [Verrucomicrobiae bacterium]
MSTVKPKAKAKAKPKAKKAKKASKPAKAASKVWVGLDLGGTKMLAKVFDEQFRELGNAKKKTEGHRGMAAGLKRMAETIEAALSAAGVDKSQVLGIGVGCPGPVDADRGILVEAPNLGWIKAPVAKSLEKAIGAKTVICNDVDSGVFAEYEFGAARGAKCAVGIFPGTGIGGGAVIHGRLLQGANLSCMEIGHIPLSPETSGNGGPTLEIAASRLAIAAEAAQAAYRGQAPHLLKECGTDISAITSGRLAASIAAGDQAIEDIIRKAATLLGAGVATVVHLLAPDVIVLGGGLVSAMPKLYLETVKASANARLLGPYRNTFKLVPAQLADDAGVKGAAAWARRALT